MKSQCRTLQGHALEQGSSDCTRLTRVFPKCRFSLSRSRVGLALCISNKLLRIWLLVGGVGHTTGSNGGDLDLDAN